MSIRTFYIPGRPTPKGSRVSGRTKSGRVYSRESNPRVKPWMDSAAAHLREQGREYDGQLQPPYRIVAEFLYAEPKRPKYQYPAQGDLDKLCRALLDSLGPRYGDVLLDDRFVTALTATKSWGASDLTTVIIMGGPE